MVQCPDGSALNTDQPAFFVYQEADLAEAIGLSGGPATGVLTWMALSLIGIPVGPQDANAFCAVEPSTDLATDLDYLAIGLGPIAVSAGVFDRIGNTVRYSKWAAMCHCKDSSGATVIGTGSATGPKQAPHATWVLLADLGTTGGIATVTLEGWESVDPHQWNLPSYCPQATVSDMNDPKFLFVGATGYASQGFKSVGETITFDLRNTAGIGNPPLPHLYLYGVSGYNPPATDLESFSWTWAPNIVPGPPINPPVVPTLPPVPDAPECGPADPTLRDLADLICKLQSNVTNVTNTVNFLIRIVGPPTVNPQPPIPPQPVNPVLPPGTPNVPLLPIPVPAGALGFVAQFTTIPPSSRDVDVGIPFYPSLAHVIPMTDEGPLASIRITFSPFVHMGLPPNVRSLIFDPQPGVVGQVSFLT